MQKRIDKTLLIFVGLFFLISLISIYGASIFISKSLGNLVFKQVIWYLAGIGIVFLIIKISNKIIFDSAWILYAIGIFLLALLLIIGVPINNSKCWFVIPGIGSVQPSEFMKIFIVLVLARVIQSFRKKYKNPTLLQEFSFIIKSLIVVGIPAVLTFLQPDTGAVIIYLVIYLSMMFFSGIRARWFLIALSIFCFGIGICGGIYFFNEELFVRLFGTSIYYRLERVLLWKNGMGLQLENALASLGSAGLLGYGIKNSPLYFPEAATDFIFAIYASNFGLIGILLLLFIFILFDFFIFSLLKKKIDALNKYVVIGVLGMIVFQQIQNIGMTLGLFPIMGITLPFISYGGSSLLSYMIIIGLLINISSLREKNYLK